MANVADDAARRSLPKLLLALESAELRKKLHAQFEQSGFSLLVAESPQEAIFFVHDEAPDVLFLGWDFPDGARSQFIQRIHVACTVRERSAIPIFLIGRVMPFADRLDALKAGAEEFVESPVDIESLLLRLHVQLRRSRHVPTTALPALSQDARLKNLAQELDRSAPGGTAEEQDLAALEARATEQESEIARLERALAEGENRIRDLEDAVQARDVGLGVRVARLQELAISLRTHLEELEPRFEGASTARVDGGTARIVWRRRLSRALDRFRAGLVSGFLLWFELQRKLELTQAALSSERLRAGALDGELQVARGAVERVQGELSGKDAELSRLREEQDGRTADWNRTRGESEKRMAELEHEIESLKKKMMQSEMLERERAEDTASFMQKLDSAETEIDHLESRVQDLESQERQLRTALAEAQENRAGAPSPELEQKLARLTTELEEKKDLIERMEIQMMELLAEN